MYIFMKQESKQLKNHQKENENKNSFPIKLIQTVSNTEYTPLNKNLFPS